jgi:hypothetical protein
MVTLDTNYEIVLYRKGTAGTITLAFNDNSFIVNGSRAWSKNENDVGTLEFGLSNGSIIPAANFMSSSFAGWSDGVTGALQLGDYVKYSLYPTLTGTKTQVFYGKITDIRPTADGQLRITAMDYLKALMREYAKIVYTNYKDAGVFVDSTDAQGRDTITGVSDSDIVQPLASVKFATADTRTTLGDDGDTETAQNIVDGKDVAQPFSPTQDGIIGLKITTAWTDSVNDTDLTVVIQKDDGTGQPDGVDLASVTIDVTGSPEINDYDIDFTTSGAPLVIAVGAVYWAVFSTTATSETLTVKTRGPVSGQFSSYLYKSDGTNWSVQSGAVLYLKIDSVMYQEIDPSDYSLNGTTITILEGVEIPNDPTQSYVTIKRGLLSYFYGTVTNQAIADALTKLNTGLVSSSSANQVAASGTFSTEGKKLLEALQELADQYMSSGAWSGYQLAFAHYESAGSQYLKWGKRLTTADSSYVTFSYGLDGTTDEEHRIIDYSGLELRSDLRPPRVVMIGTDASGRPLCYTITDKALTDSFETRMEGFANVQKVVDENLATMADVRSHGDGTIAKYAFNVWEGPIVVSGVYPDLIDLGTGSTSFGSGKIITLNLSPLGISNQKFKVKGVQVEANQTTITISNVDLAVMNAQKYYNLKANRTEAFYAPVGLADDVYIAVFCDSTVSGSAYHMTLEDSTGTAITGLVPVLCAKHVVAAYNLNVYQGIFEKDNGYSAPPYGVRYIRLYSGATLIATYDLYSASAPVRDERFDKFKTMRLIVDFMTKIS